MSFSRRNFLKMSRHKRNQEEPFHATASRSFASNDPTSDAELDSC